MKKISKMKIHQLVCPLLAVSLSGFLQRATAQASDDSDPNDGRNYVAERAEIDAAWAMLDLKWSEWLSKSGKANVQPPTSALPKSSGARMSLPEMQKLEISQNTLPPERRSLALTTLNGYYEPGELVAANGTLSTTLTVTYGRNMIGKDPVYLRSYNGQLVGPTLRARPGDVMRLTVRNTLPTEPWKPDSMNKLHGFNTTNFHTHGLHVSPNGISDNVLLEIKPGATQEYVIEIPEDHPCGTFWYHPHHHGSTAGNVASGMSGALIIEGGIDEIPSIKAAKERVMVLNQILYVNEVPSANPNEPNQVLPYGVIEEKYVGLNLGPGDAAKLGRFTTINGVQLPVIRMRPGQLERWRLIDSAQSEIIALQIVAANDDSLIIPFHEIACDGIAREKAVKKAKIELLPGYRSDVLVQIDKAGEYLLVDQAKLGMKATNVPLQYVARVIVEGEPVTGMKMPTDKEMAPFVPQSLVDAKDFGNQTAVYGIELIQSKDGKPKPLFVIDGESFDMDKARELKLGHTDEWKVSVKNAPAINTGHPFHIHVNAFQVTSILGPEDPTKPDSPMKEWLEDGPVWRDTIWVPNNGTVTFRTKYEDFIGTFVQHCHILDHEDQGMMQLIDIVDPSKPTAKLKLDSAPTLETGVPAPDFDLSDASGKRHQLSKKEAGAKVVFLFKGHGCLHCVQQVQQFNALHKEFQAKGIELIGITTHDEGTLKTALTECPSPFTILADPQAKAFAAFGCVRSGGLLHGTFLINEQGLIDWRTTGSNPYLSLRQLLEKAPAQASASVQFQ